MNVQAFSNPFRHWVFNWPGAPAALHDAAKDMPPDHWPHWVRYDWELERKKRTCNLLEALPPSVAALLHHLRSTSWVDRLHESLRLDFPIYPDPLLWGAGVHVTDPGGNLGVHLDYAKHRCGLERRLNLILFLNREWREEWGGACELWDETAKVCVKRIVPQFGRVLCWEASDTAYHATQTVSADAPPRASLACYYLSDPRPGCVRREAHFVRPR